MVAIPQYKNTQFQSDILDDTIQFLYNIIGCYIQVEIKSGKPYITMVINQSMVQNQSLSDNSRCYTQWSIPSQKREHGIWKVIEDMCKERTITDRIFFITLGDYPILQSDKSTHPHWLRYTSNNYQGIYPNRMYPIYSRSIIPGKHMDRLFPTRDYIDVVYGIENIISNTNRDFVSKKPMAIFRGSITGATRTVSNTRVQARILALQYPEYLDVELTKTFDYYMYEENSTLCVWTNILDKRIYNPDNTKTKSLSGFEQATRFRYLLHIDGFVSAWRLALELLSFSVILKVDSDWVEHYYSELLPWIHYIPVKADLSDLIQTIDWCNCNQDLCVQIATNAYNYAKTNFTKSKLFDYLEGFDVQDQCVDYFDPIPRPVFNEIPRPTYSLDSVELAGIDNPAYSRYLLPQTEPEPEYPEKISNNFFQFETIISEIQCDQITEQVKQTEIYKKLGSTITETNELYMDLGDNFNGLCEDIIKQLDQEISKSNLGFELKWLSSNFIFSNKPVYSYLDPFVRLSQCFVIVFLSTGTGTDINSNSNSGYQVDNVNKTWLPSIKGRVILFDPNIHFIEPSDIPESFQLLFPVHFGLNKWEHLGLFEKYYWVETQNQTESLRILINNIEYSNTITIGNEQVFQTINKKNNLGGAWFWEIHSITIDLNLNLNLNPNRQIKQTEQIEQIQTQIKFNPTDMITDLEIWYQGKKINESNYYIQSSKTTYKPNEIICLISCSNYINDLGTKNLIINNLIINQTDIINQTINLDIKYKSYLLVTDLRKFMART